MPTDLIERVEHDFTLHPPSSSGIGSVMDDIRARFKELALAMAAELPAGREQNLVLTKLEEACFFAIASIARTQSE